jgi:hypothetical protein
MRSLPTSHIKLHLLSTFNTNSTGTVSTIMYVVQALRRPSFITIEEIKFKLFHKLRDIDGTIWENVCNISGKIYFIIIGMSI